MYTPQDEQFLFNEARELLQQPVTDIEKTILRLRDVINYADWKYYIHSNPSFADAEYDQLFALLKKLERENPEFIVPDSPTQRVAVGLSEKLQPVPHLVPMLSLDNTYNSDDLRDWDRRCRELAGSEDIEYCVEPKYDGASISLIYEDDKLVRGATRGDGVMGEEITANIRQIRSLPLAAGVHRQHLKQIEIRGEVVIHKETFAQLNKQRAEDGLPPLANPRNAASGTLRMLDPAEVGRRKLSAVLYHVSYFNLDAGYTRPEVLSTHQQSLQWLYSIGFPTPAKELRLFNRIDDVIEYCEAFEKRRDDLPYEVDGLVIKVNSIDMQEQMGMTAHHPRWAVAYKFKARQATSKLRSVEFQVGRTGSVTPVAKIDPVPIGGVTVGSISLFNEDVVREKDLLIGDTVLVERAGDVIPYIVKSLPELRNGTESPIVFPTHCPVCSEALEKPEEEAVWRCININCEAQVVERIIHFCSKDAMDIRGMGSANVKKFYDLGIVTSIPQLYDIDWSRVSGLEGFGEKSIHNLKSAIEASKQQPLNRVIFGLGIRHVGETTAKNLANAVNHIRDFYDWDLDKLITLEDIGPKVAASVLHFFHTHSNQDMIDVLERQGVNLSNLHKANQADGGEWSGRTFLFTGTLSQLKRSEAEAMVEARGGAILSGVSSKLNYLVVGADAGSKLEKAKKLGTVTILNEEEFIRMTNAD